MRIGIYVDVARDEKPTGIGRHVLCLLDSLAAIDNRNEYRLYYPTTMMGRQSPFRHTPQQANFAARPVRFPQGWEIQHPRLWWKWRLPNVLKADRIDLFHGPNHFLPKFDRRRTILTIHDLAFFKMAVHGNELDQVFQHWTRLAFDWAGTIIALSENTRRDVEQLGVEADRIRVVYGGGNIVPEERIEYGRMSELRQQLKLPEQFILFVGALQPRKNLPFLVRAFADLKRQHPELPHKLVLAGPQLNATEEIRGLARQLSMEADVQLTGYLDDWQIPLLYKAASLFALPTAYEGFTLVTLEAMAYGTPVVATDSSSIKEGVGESAILVEVDNTRQLSNALYRGLTDLELRRQLVDSGRDQAKKFTWEKCAAETIALYEEQYRNIQQPS